MFISFGSGETALRACIFGIGSPHGDDQAGWRLIEALTKRSDVDARLVALHTTASLLDHLDGCRRLILVDACQSEALPGTIFRWQWPDAAISRQTWRSSHQVDVRAALELAETLGRLPSCVVLFGIEIEACLPGTDLSPAVERGLHSLERDVMRELTQAIDCPGKDDEVRAAGVGEHNK